MGLGSRLRGNDAVGALLDRRLLSLFRCLAATHVVATQHPAADLVVSSHHHGFSRNLSRTRVFSDLMFRWMETFSNTLK